jgi:hypothetical protein
MLVIAVVAARAIGAGGTPEPDADAHALAARVERLPPRAAVLVSLDYGPATAGECRALASAVTRHLLARDARVYLASLWPAGSAQIVRLRHDLRAELSEKEYGRDWIDLGFKAGGTAAILGMAADFRAVHPTDVSGAAIDAFEMMRDIDRLTAFDLIVAIGSGWPGPREWVQFATDGREPADAPVAMPAGAHPAAPPIAACVTSAQRPLLWPYARRLVALVAGVRGAAEYEELTRSTAAGAVEGEGVRGRAAPSAAQARHAGEAGARLTIAALIGAAWFQRIRARWRGDRP